ncbi:MAG: hypothetical protein ACLQIQ_12555 [Beijerinckiaceae bacterium]
MTELNGRVIVVTGGFGALGSASAACVTLVPSSSPPARRQEPIELAIAEDVLIAVAKTSQS